MVDRIPLILIIDPAADEASSHTGPWKTELMLDRIATEFENPYGEIGEAYAHGPEVVPFDDIQVMRLAPALSAEYDRMVGYLKRNPQLLERINFGADRPSVLRSLSFRVKRQTPFESFEREKVPLAGYVSQTTENDLSVVVPVSAVLDAWTHLELSVDTLPAQQERVTVILETNGGVDVRTQL